MSKTCRLVAALAAALMVTAPQITVQAHSVADPSAIGDVGKLVAASNLVFHGKVKAIVYRSGKAGNGTIPYTFVTYAVDETLMGNPRPEVTMRFVGGSDGQGGFVAAEGVPSFSLGDEDILFVANNGSAGCPLVLCEFGRYRVYGGNVYEAHGSPVLSVVKGRIQSGGAGPAALQTISYPAPSFDDMIKNPAAMARIKSLGMTLDQARARYEREAPKTITIATGSTDKAAGQAPAKPGLALGTVMASLKSAIAAAPKRPLALLPDANPAAGIPAIAIQPAQPTQ